MSNNGSEREFVKPSDPIAINTSARRSRSVSVSSGSSGSDSTPELQTPASPSPANSHRFSLPSPGSSPILSYFLGQSPTKAPGTATFPFNRKFGPPPVFEDEEEVIPATHQARRASTVVAGRFAQPQSNPLPDPQLERGSNLLRRLSLSCPLVKPQMEPSHRTSRPPPSPPPNTAVNPTPKSLPFARDRKPARSATVNEGPRPRRAPSPMGERILKGHFDGFN